MNRINRRIALWVMGCLFHCIGVAVAESPHHAALVNPDGSWKYTNALANQTSPYLRQHAHNPVDWKPWGDAAFAEAAERDVPIFLSIGYSTCYWCHVMERQVFENPAIARQMNEQFVCVKVDREERPDVDDIYMTATQLLTGSGGWPMSVFLTPGSHADDGDALLPFWAGTYIPPTPAYGRPSFPQVMDAMSQAWNEEREQVIEQSQRVAEAVRQQVAAGRDEAPVSREMTLRTAAQLRQRYDPTHGGFSGNQGPKFPTPSTVALLLDVYRLPEPEGRDETLAEQIQHTLDRMARGGMYDQVGGGFHRYSVDEQWLVPHFEKMLYDNGQLLELYAQAHETWPNERGSALYARVLRETADYLLREMRDGTGAFWSAQDAEVNASEGQNYVWTPEQVRAALAEEPDAEALTALALKMYGLDRGTNFQDPHQDHAPKVNVLFMPGPMSSLTDFADGDMAGVMEMRQRINAALLKVRDTRDQPGTDDKVLTAWNGLAIAGLAEAGRVLDEPRYVQAAQQAADAILRHMSTDVTGGGGLLRSMRDGEAKIPAFLEDYAFLIHGLLRLDHALAEAETGGRYLAEAERLAAYVQQHFSAAGSSGGGGYFDTLAGQADLFVRTRSTYDGALPSGNSQMIHNLVTLAQVTDGDRQSYLDQVVRNLRSFAEPLGQSGLGVTHLQRALLRLTETADARGREQMESPGVDPPPAKPNPVDVSVEALPGEANAYRVVLNIAEGYHVNANPASADELIPTQVSAEGVALDVSYPVGENKRYTFSDVPLSVYEGEVVIQVRSPTSIKALVLTYQACTATACLAPTSIAVSLSAAGR